MVRAAVALAVMALVVAVAAAQTNDPPVSIQGDGSLVIPGAAEVPPYAEGGRWTETPGRSSSRHLSRHFMFMPASGPPPVMELFVTRDIADEPPDGGFEVGLVDGFLRGFTSGIGFRYEAPIFETGSLGPFPMRRCRVRLSKDDREMWLYAYVLLARPSLTFLTVRRQSDARPAIESFLSRVKPR